MNEEKRRHGDRKDGKLLRDLDALHFITANIYPNRCDNEAYISERIDLENINKWLEAHNGADEEFPYTMFHLIVTAVLKCITLRPKMNRFIANKNFYQRNEVSASFIVKKKFSDDGGEGLAFVRSRPENTVFDIHERIRHQVMDARHDKSNSTDDSMDFFNRMPRGLAKFILKIMCMLDRHGKVPQSLIAADPYYASVIFSNLGSIKLKCGYHHLTNWGTNSLFVIVGEKKKRPVFNDDGTYEMKESIELGLTVDERIADGYYFSGTVKLLKKLLENPELLEKQLSEGVDF